MCTVVHSRRCNVEIYCKKLGLSVKTNLVNTERSKILVETKNQPCSNTRIDSPIPQVIEVPIFVFERAKMKRLNHFLVKK